MTPPIRPGPAAAATADNCAKPTFGFLHGLSDDAVEQVDMGARRDLRHHAAETGVLVDLRVHDIGQDPAAAVALALDHGGRGFVAGGLDTQHQHRRVVVQFDPLRYRNASVTG